MNIDDFKDTLNDKMVLITGAGGGIGFEKSSPNLCVNCS